ncbi:hypothetical protein HMPREF0493_1648 [Lactobacillus amylolyticus DSM 11664]|uniref:Uncharacterized protein n=1 Tax=Lactobacillus amylolyticus DSM 11664 TaxID=585524 RepID=D4YVT7_9LACO|nr:hypothetical protein HMPREF0493_1648 [Lactobacillus amylolyticus DSM 11664]
MTPEQVALGSFFVIFLLLTKAARADKLKATKNAFVIMLRGH